MTTRTIGSLCTGYGGLDLAAAEAFDARTIWTSDIDNDAAVVIAERFPGAPNIGDLTAVDWRQVERPDILTAGYPCQPFSTAGARLGANDDRHLWPAVADAVSALRPAVVVLENVSGHLSMGAPAVVGDLAGRGYLGSWRLVRASDVGAPHQRGRLFIVATDAAREGRGPRARHDFGRGSTLVGRADTCNGSRGTAADADDGTGHRERPRPEPDRRSSFGEYWPAVDRWERIIGRPAPEPAIALGRSSRRRLNPRFVEWMMGLRDGWVTELELARSAQLRLLGNGVVPQQALAAIRSLEAMTAEAGR